MGTSTGGLRPADAIGWAIVIWFAGSLNANAAASGGVDHDLRIANEYFSRRLSRLAFLSTDASIRIPAPRYHSGQSWRVRLQLVAPPAAGAAREATQTRTLRYQVVEWKDDESLTLHLRVQDEQAQRGDGFLEERLSFAALTTEIRRCRSGRWSRQTCSPWSRVTAQTLKLAGELQGEGWEHGPVWLPLETLRMAARLKPGNGGAIGLQYESEDFFGRSYSWSWSEGSPWPERMSSAQGTATLIGEGGRS